MQNIWWIAFVANYKLEYLDNRPKGTLLQVMMEGPKHSLTLFISILQMGTKETTDGGLEALSQGWWPPWHTIPKGEI